MVKKTHVLLRKKTNTNNVVVLNVQSLFEKEKAKKIVLQLQLNGTNFPTKRLC